MFGGWIRLDDLWRLREKLRQGYGQRVWAALPFRPARHRVERTWQHAHNAPRHWGALPQVQARWREKISGDPAVGLQAYVTAKYFAAAEGLRALSIGCGSGGNEVKWAQTGVFAHIDAFDVSAGRIAAAQERAAAAGVSHLVDFAVADARALPAAYTGYDVLLAENAFHHLSPLEPAMLDLRDRVRPGGWLLLRDYVGPSRFQWTDAQLTAVEALLAQLSEAYRRRWKSGTVKRRFYRPGRLSVQLADPSEAAESARILPLLARHFAPVEQRDLGGTVLHLLLEDIAFHFLDPDPEAAAWLAAAFAEEDRLLAAGILPSDFVFAVYRKPA